MGLLRVGLLVGLLGVLLWPLRVVIAAARQPRGSQGGLRVAVVQAVQVRVQPGGSQGAEGGPGGTSVHPDAASLPALHDRDARSGQRRG